MIPKTKRSLTKATPSPKTPSPTKTKIVTPKKTKETWSQTLLRMKKRRQQVERMMDTDEGRVYIEEACSTFKSFEDATPQDIHKLRELAARVGIEEALTMPRRDLCYHLLTGWLTVFGEMVVYPAIRNGTIVIFSMMMLHNFSHLQKIITSIMNGVVNGTWAASFGLPIQMISQGLASIKTHGLWSTLTLSRETRIVSTIWSALAGIPGLAWTTTISIAGFVELPKSLGFNWVVPSAFRTNATLKNFWKIMESAMPFRRNTGKARFEQIWRYDLFENYLPYGLSIATVTAITGALAMLREHNRKYFFKYDSQLKKLHNTRWQRFIEHLKTWTTRAVKYGLIVGLTYRYSK